MGWLFDAMARANICASRQRRFHFSHVFMPRILDAGNFGYVPVNRLPLIN
jgi:hypothetical protein